MDNYQFSTHIEYCSQSPYGSSIHSNNTQSHQIYDKLSLLNQQQSRTTLLQPLKSFSNQNSIPNTPRHALFNNDQLIKSPQKSYFHVPIFNPTNDTLSHFGNGNEFNNEMANLEGIMKDLSAITSK